MSLLEEALRRQEENRRKQCAMPASAPSAVPEPPESADGGRAVCPHTAAVPEPAPSVPTPSEDGRACRPATAAAGNGGASDTASSRPIGTRVPENAPKAHRVPRASVHADPGEHRNDAAAFAAAAEKLRRKEPRASRPNVILMPVIAIIVLVVLLYAKKLISPREAQVANFEESDSAGEIQCAVPATTAGSGVGESQAGSAVCPHTAAVPASTTSVPASTEDGRASRPATAENGRDGAPSPSAVPVPPEPAESGRAVCPQTAAVPASTSSVPASTSSVPASTEDGRASRPATAADGRDGAPPPSAVPVTPSLPTVMRAPEQAPEAQSVPRVSADADLVEPQSPPVWPLFKLHGIAAGKENIVILDKGEMLSAGERSKNGVKVESISPDSAVFSWKNERKTLRRGESSDKPADQSQE